MARKPRTKTITLHFMPWTEYRIPAPGDPFRRCVVARAATLRMGSMAGRRFGLDFLEFQLSQSPIS
jgi:hypothetical protein